MKPTSNRHSSVPRVAPISVALAQAGLLAAVMSPPAAAAARTGIVPPAVAADATMLYLAQSASDYGKMPWAKPPAAPPPKIYNAPPKKGDISAGDGAGSGATGVPQGKPAPVPDPRNSTR